MSQTPYYITTSRRRNQIRDPMPNITAIPRPHPRLGVNLGNLAQRASALARQHGHLVVNNEEMPSNHVVNRAYYNRLSQTYRRPIPRARQTVNARELQPEEVHVYANNECAPGEICDDVLYPHPTILGQATMLGADQNRALPLATGIEGQHITRPVNSRRMWMNYHNSIHNGTLRAINKYGNRVPIGERNYRVSGRSIEEIEQEMERLRSNPDFVHNPADVNRYSELSFMVREYYRHQREEMDRRASRSDPSLRNMTASLRNGALSALSSAGQGIRGLFGRATTRNRSRSPGVTRTSPGGTRRSPGGTRTSPGGTRRSPGGTRRSPGGRRRSPGERDR